MPKIKGLFANLPGITHISAGDVRDYSKRREDVHLLEDEIGNRVLYPHVLPISAEDLSLNTAIIHEVIGTHPEQYFDKPAGRITVPEAFLSVVPDLQKLVWAFLDVFHPYGSTALFLKNRFGAKSLGTFLKVNVLSEGLIDLWLHGEKHLLPTGTIKILPAAVTRVAVKFESENAELLGHKSIAIEVFGGPLGLIVDTTL